MLLHVDAEAPNKPFQPLALLQPVANVLHLVGALQARGAAPLDEPVARSDGWRRVRSKPHFSIRFRRRARPELPSVHGYCEVELLDVEQDLGAAGFEAPRSREEVEVVVAPFLRVVSSAFVGPGRR